MRCLYARPDISADGEIGLVIRQKSRVNFKGLAVTAEAENHRPRKKRFPDVRSLGEDDTSDIHAQEAARKPYPLLIEHEESRESIATQR